MSPLAGPLRSLAKLKPQSGAERNLLLQQLVWESSALNAAGGLAVQAISVQLKMPAIDPKLEKLLLSGSMCCTRHSRPSEINRRKFWLAQQRRCLLR